jgi:cold shock CspA family protein
MRHKGTLVDWNDDRGFGFIEPAEGGSRVFIHIKAFEVRVRRPIVGDRVTYELAKGSDGRINAARVRPIGLEDASYQSNVRTKLKPRDARSRVMGRLIAALVVGVVSLYASTQYTQTRATRESSKVAQNVAPSEAPPAATRSGDALSLAFAQHQSNLQVQASGVVDRVLSDDNDESRHQRFIVRLPSGQTVLIAHNIDLAPRVVSLAQGDQVEFNGQYEWNEKGGVVHWTHRDPKGGHQAGWIKHNGQTFQ